MFTRDQTKDAGILSTFITATYGTYITSVNLHLQNELTTHVPLDVL
jgi:hypothetical protein